MNKYLTAIIFSTIVSYSAHGYFISDDENSKGTRPPVDRSVNSSNENADRAYYGYRFYSPQIGRWLNRDPLGETSFQIQQGASARPLPRIEMNRYLFTKNSPTSLIDPFGLDVQPPIDPHYPHENEGKSCCCGSKPCSVDFSATASGSGLKIKVEPSLKSEGCCSDFHIRTWTCSYGNQKCWDTPLDDWFWPIIQGDYVYVHVYVSYLACSGNPGTWTHQFKLSSHICERSLFGGWSCN